MQYLSLAIIAVVIIFAPAVHKQDINPAIKIDYELHAQLIRRTELLSRLFGKNMETYTLMSHPVTVTAYAATEEECNSDPEHTATGALSMTGIVALSRDLFETTSIKRGDRILLLVAGLPIGVFTVEDLMSTHKYKGTDRVVEILNSVDILMGNAKAASLFGVKQGEISWVVVPK
jgi:3D (Asp-Asp-Asp) domain-containing protein